MIKQIKDTISKMEKDKKRLDIYRYLKEQWKCYPESSQLCVLIIQQMVSFLLELESPWAISENANEYQCYAAFLQEVLQYGIQYHSKSKMFLWQLCYYLAGISTYHFLYGKVIQLGSAKDLLNQLLDQADKLFPDSKLFQLIPLFQKADTSWKAKLQKSEVVSIRNEIEEWNLQANAVDQELLDLFDFPD